MKLFHKVAKWFYNKYYSLTAARCKVTAVKEYPKNIKTETIYVVSDGPIPDTLIFKCPCGCNVDIYLNLLKDTRPNWSYGMKCHIANYEKAMRMEALWLQ